MCSRLMCLALACILITGCSVKEDRHNCPCILTFCMDNLRGSHLQEMKTATVSYLCGEAGCLLPGEVPPEMEFEVPRTGISPVFHSLSEGWGKVMPGNDLIIPAGQECPGIYTYSTALVTSCETLRDTVEMHRNFTKIRIVAPAFEGIADSLCVTGNVNGYSISGVPLLGDFSYSQVPDEENAVIVAVPRQLDPSLKLLVRVNNTTFRTFAIGWAIVASGYDWSMPDLQDITVEVDYAATRVSYSTDPWSVTQTFSVEM